MKSGKREDGSTWEWALVQSPGPRQPSIMVFFDNAPSGVNYSGMFKVRKISRITVKNSKDEQGNWHRHGKIIVNATVLPVEDLGYEPVERKRRSHTQIVDIGELFND